jgi:hypothetical protein
MSGIAYKVADLSSFEDDLTSRLLTGRSNGEFFKENKPNNCMLLDYGGFKTLAGYNTRDKHIIGVNSIVGKNKEDKYLDLNLDQFDILKNNYKSLMERDYVNCMSVFELISDHMMTQLVGDKPIECKVMLSECMAQP